MTRIARRIETIASCAKQRGVPHQDSRARSPGTRCASSRPCSPLDRSLGDRLPVSTSWQRLAGDRPSSDRENSIHAVDSWRTSSWPDNGSRMRQRRNRLSWTSSSDAVSSRPLSGKIALAVDRRKPRHGRMPCDASERLDGHQTCSSNRHACPRNLVFSCRRYPYGTRGRRHGPHPNPAPLQHHPPAAQS